MAKGSMLGELLEIAGHNGLVNSNECGAAGSAIVFLTELSEALGEVEQRIVKG